MTTPQIGLPGQYVDATGAVFQAIIQKVNSDGTVDAEKSTAGSTSLLRTSLPFVDVGATPPAAGTKYFQAIDLVN